ncbi:MAG: hypothetical protein M3348_18805 [Acidobacteriota bacterium]|nr:hypothetical protein [Acidobacteriota bacterium]
MKLLIFAFTLLLWLSCPAAGQDRPDDLRGLHDYLPVPATVPIVRAESPALPSERPLKIYLNTAGDQTAQLEVLKLVQDKKTAEKYGAIEIVTDGSQANLFLVHYEVDGKRQTESSHSMTMDPSSTSRIYGGGRSDSQITAEFRGYVLARTSRGLEVLSSYQHRINLAEPRRDLRVELLKLLNRQAKSQQH